MPKFLNNIDLDSNQLLNPVIHTSPQSTTTNGPAGDATGTEGQIFYNSDAKALFFRDNTAWRPIGDISGVAAGVGLSGGGTGGAVTLTIDFSEFSDVTPVNGDKLATLDSDGTTEQLTTIASLATLFAGSGLTATDSVIAVDTLNQSTTGQSGSVANALTVDNATVQLDTGTTYNGSAALTLSAKTASIADGGTALATADQIHTFVTGASTTGNAATVTTNANLSGHVTSVGNTASLGSFTLLQLNTAISDGTVGTQTLPTDFVSAASGGTFSGNVSFGDNNISNVGVISVDSIDADHNSIKIGNQASKTVELGKANTDDSSGDPTNPSVETGVVVKGSLTVDGKLTVAGDFETTSTSNTIIKDRIIQLNAGAVGQNETDFGIVFNRGSETNVALRWDEGDLLFDFIATGSDAASSGLNAADPNSDGESTAGSANHQDLRIGSLTATKAIAGSGTNITGLNGSNISSGTVNAAYIGNLGAGKITSGTLGNDRISSGSVTQHVGDIVHDSLSGFEANEHIDWTADQGTTNIHTGNYDNTDTIDMGDGFTVAATTTGTGTTITEGDSLTIAAGTGISTTGTSDGVVTIASTLTTNANHTGDVTGSGALTLAAAQTNVTSLYNADLKVGRGTDNQIDFATDDHIIFTTKDDSELTLSDTHLYPSAVQGLHLGSTTNGFRSLNLIANTNDQHGSLIRIEKQRTNSTTALQNDDDLARFSFNGNNAAGATKEYMRWLVEASDVTTDSEAVTYKQLFLTDGTIRTGFKVTGQADDTLDVNIGYGATGVTTLAGTLTVGSTAVIDNSGGWVGGALGQSYIGTETIDESRLEVSNAPTDDYVLVADSSVTGGLKWASASTTAGNVATATNLAANTDQAVPVGTIELGHASDTTIARSAAGKATIEGNLIGVVKTFTLNDTAPVQSNNDNAASTVFTITHGMGDSRFYKVEVVLNSSNYDTVFADIARPNDTTITVTFASNVALGAYAAMVTRMA